jgi:hypothetical protein
LYKNLSILDFVSNNISSKDRFLDCGSGPSPLAYILCDQFSEGYMIDISVRNSFVKKNLHHNIGDFFEYLCTIPDGSLDYALDGCSLIHFNYNNYENVGLVRASELLSKKIKNNGYLVMSSDVISHLQEEKLNQSEFLKVENIINIFNRNDLHLICDFDYDSLDENFNINLNYHNRFMINLNYCNLVFQKKMKNKNK